MSTEIIAALVGAVVGALASGIITWVITRQQMNVTRTQRLDDRTWQLVLRLSEGAARILSVHVPDGVVSKPEEVEHLLADWGPTARQLIVLDSRKEFQSAIHAVGDYLQALMQFANGSIPRGLLEDIRSSKKREVEDVVGKYRTT